MIFRLAVKDIVHDWLLSACLVLAIASIIAPLLILFGLKSGTIETMRGRLIEDPKNREIRPMTTRSFSMEWFNKVKTTISEAAFVVPMTRQISTTISVANPVKETREQLSLMATAADDPLLLENGVKVPGQGFCVLTETAAQSLQASIGDDLSFSTRRIANSRTESGEFTVRVAGILEARASSLKTAYVPLETLEAVEDFKDGRAVAAYGWKGELPAAYPVFQGAAVFVPNPLGKLDEVLLTNNTGFSQIKKIDGNQIVATLGFVSRHEWPVYLLQVKQREATEESIQAVRNKLRGKDAIVVPWVEPLEITLTSATHPKPIAMRLYAAGDEIGEAIASHQSSGDAGSLEAAQPLLIPTEAPIDEGEATLAITVEDRSVSLPVILIKGGEIDGRVFAGDSFAGKLNLLRYRNLKYDEQAGRLLLFRGGYAGFRMYAKNIDEVAALQRKLESEGITVSTEQERIEEVRRLNKYMSLIFWLIAAVGVTGGLSALTANLYASVERKKRELNVLRLLGLLKRELIMFPVFQGLMLSGGALALGGIIFVLVSGVINYLFRAHLRTAESLCTLSWRHFMLLVFGVSILSICSAAFAALQATRLDPAEALRDE